MENLREKKYFVVSHRYRQDREGVWKVVAGFLQKKYFPKVNTVLDIGAGYCGFINNINAEEKYALDKDEVLKKYAGPDVRTSVQDCTNLGVFQSNFFDVVFASNLLEHLTAGETEKLLSEAKRVLKPAGKLILLQPNFTYAFKHYFDDFTHKQIFTHVGLEDLLKAFDFKIIKNFPKFMPYTMRSKLPTYSWLVKLYLFSPLKPFAGQMLIVAEK